MEIKQHLDRKLVIKVCVYFFTATFDIQNPAARWNGDGITVTGEFIIDSFAVGCFIVLQCDESIADLYQAIPRNESEQTVSETINVPPATYIVYVYDIKDDGLPYEMSANAPENGITITTNCKYVHVQVHVYTFVC